jgi:hypothetical protein
MNTETITKVLEKNIYFYEKNEYGHVIMVMKDITRLKLKSENINRFIQKVIECIEKSLVISSKYGKTTGYVHVYMNDCLLRDISISMFRKLNKELSERFENTVENIFIYSNTSLIKKLWGIVKLIVDPETRKKIKVITNKE